MLSEQLLIPNAQQSTPRRTILCDKCHNTFISNLSHPPVPVKLLKSHEIPTDMQVSQTLAVIVDEEKEVNRYIVEIQKLRRAMDRLESEKAEIQGRIRDRKGWISASRRIPSEILSTIFLEYFTNNEHTLEIGTKHISAPTLHLSHVSSHWRNTTISLPKMWSRFTVSINDNVELRSAEDLIALYLQRAGNHALTLHLRVGIAAPQETLIPRLGRHGRSILRILVQALPRCKEVSVGVQDDFLWTFDQSLLNSISFPLLETFSDIFTDYDRQLSPFDEEATFWRPLADAPMLRSVFLSSDFLINANMLPYGQLTTVHLCSAPLRHALHIFQVCTNLSILTLEGLYEGTEPLNTPTMAQNLTRLDLRDCFSDDLSCLFESVTLPSLVCLGVDASIPIDDDMGEAMIWHCESQFISMLRRSSASLQELSLKFNEVYLTPSGVKELLSLCSQLTSLKVHASTSPLEDMEQWAIVPQLLQQLVSEASHGSTLAPRLTAIDLQEEIFSESAAVRVAEAALGMVESRGSSNASEPVLRKTQVVLVLHEPRSDGTRGEVGTSQMFVDECLELGKKGSELKILFRVEPLE
ncbi:hypothetical protein VNI00_009040 [Paramarasmius palmivorus]|uniref:F-box domain-containing protein n=1 Tax=Paramarasmius palmivorus TaxID=297713 RepID=A0AAW0CRE8_9AGAR